MAKTFRRPLRGSALVCLLIGTLSVANAYTPDNHERSVRKGAARLEADHGTAIEAAAIENMVEGVREPDKLSPGTLPDGNAAGRTRLVGQAARHLYRAHRVPVHSRQSEPNPASIQEHRRGPGEEGEDDPDAGRAELMPDRLNLDVYSYDTNQAVRNKLLLNASQFLCVSFAHGDDQRSASKLGNLLHMVGDSYSASHVQRSAPEGGEDTCGTEKIEWHFSMDLIVWKAHAPADAGTTTGGSAVSSITPRT